MSPPKTLWKPQTPAEISGFDQTFCAKCVEDGMCPIRADGLAQELGSPAFPREWIVGDDGPECTALTPVEDEDCFDEWEE